MSPPFNSRRISFVWPAFCVVLGAAIGIAIGHIWIGICIGLLLGTGIGMLLARGRNSGRPGTKH